MLFSNKDCRAIHSHTLVVDALDLASRIEASDREALLRLNDELDEQYHKFRSTIPNDWVFVTPKKVFSSKEFSTFRLNDMFVLYSSKAEEDAALKYLATSSLLYQTLLITGFIPRGGLGFRLIMQGNNSIIGAGFIDAYKTSEKRDKLTKDICAIHVSANFMRIMPNSERAYRLLCFYENNFFLNPRALHDPEIGKFDNERIITLLRSVGTNKEKLDATEKFLEEFEDYEAANKPISKSRQLVKTKLDSFNESEGGK